MAHTFADILRPSGALDLTHDEEAALVHAAQLGDSDAFETLARAYAPALRSAISQLGDSVDPEEAAQEAGLAFFELVAAHDTADGRLALKVKHHMRRALLDSVGAGGAWAIPARTQRRFFGILRKAGGDVSEARRLAPSFEMAPATFDALRAALNTDTIDAPTDGEEAPHSVAVCGPVAHDVFVEVEDVILADLALGAMAPDERVICRAAYGFDEVIVDDDVIEPIVSDALIGAALGISRPTVQRRRASGLAAAREALALDEEAAA